MTDTMADRLRYERMTPELLRDAINELDRQNAEITKLKVEAEDENRSFALRWNADMRAIKRWQAATGRELVWPDHADLCVWLLEQLDAVEENA
jgi:pyrroloquinoline quinone (PQQ) biosynthesis protein C